MNLFLSLFAVFVFFSQPIHAAKEVVIVYCLVCENANCPTGTMSPQGHCYKAYYKNYCDPKCAGADWAGTNPPPKCVGYPKLAEYGTKPATCATTTTTTTPPPAKTEWFCTSSIGDKYYSTMMQCQGLQEKDGSCNFNSQTATAMSCKYDRVVRAKTTQTTQSTPPPPTQTKQSPTQQASQVSNPPQSETVETPVSEAVVDTSNADQAVIEAAEQEKQRLLAEEQAQKAAEKAKLIELAKKETAAAQKESANLKSTISGLKVLNENAVYYYAQKANDLKSGKKALSGISSKDSVLEGLSNASGISSDKEFGADGSSEDEAGGKGKAGSKKKGGKYGISSSKNKGLAGKNGESGGSDGENSSGAENGSEDSDGSAMSKTGRIDPSKALELLKARLARLSEDSSGGAVVEGTELQKLIDLIESGKVTVIDEEKLRNFLNSKPEFHLDESDTQAAIRDLIGEFEQAQYQSQMLDTDLFTRVKDTYKRSVKAGRVKNPK